MCEACEQKEDQDRLLWEAVRLGLIGMQRGLLAIVKGIERRYDIPRNKQKAA